jgi:hypothetical protein
VVNFSPGEVFFSPFASGSLSFFFFQQVSLSASLFTGSVSFPSLRLLLF